VDVLLSSTPCCIRSRPSACACVSNCKRKTNVLRVLRC
jgi:hypothetical protein